PTPTPAPPPPPPAAVAGGFIWPTTGTITQYFGENPAFYGPGGHNGIDIANAQWTPLVAADAGVVIFSGWRGGLGNAVGIDHQNGFVTWYGHAVQLVASPGQWVARGQLIAYMGTTGVSTGPHLHFIIVRDEVYVDPMRYLPR
ncbi:MAG: M23 family metallopeptidase, partial [Chloroflexota bacterium]|nr:M23 family metallopeptidase [Chloroflexota bacterium]